VDTSKNRLLMGASVSSDLKALYKSVIIIIIIIIEYAMSQLRRSSRAW